VFWYIEMPFKAGLTVYAVPIVPISCVLFTPRDGSRCMALGTKQHKFYKHKNYCNSISYILFAYVFSVPRFMASYYTPPFFVSSNFLTLQARYRTTRRKAKFDIQWILILSCLSDWNLKHLFFCLPVNESVAI